MWILPKYLQSAFFQGPLDSISEPSMQASSLEASFTWRGKPTPAKSWLRAWTKATWLQRLSGRMCPPSMESHFVEWWTASLADSRAKTSPSPESKRGSPASEAGSGRSLLASSKKYSLDWSSLRTSQPSGRKGSKSSSLILPRSGSMRSGVLTERPMLEPLTRGTDSSCWPTTTTTDSKASGAAGYSTASGRHSGTTLTDRAVRQWGTPRATDGDKGGPNQSLKGKPSLVAQARKQWPTPDASVSTGYNQSASSGASIRYSLAGKVTKQWPTTTVGDGDKYSVKTNPNSQAAKSLHPTSLDLSSLLDPKMKSRGEESSSQGRTLNPRFVEWLMGWPIGWTDCDSPVTEWFLLKPLKL